MDFIFSIINWNIGGAKYLQLKKKQDIVSGSNELSRDEFREKLNFTLEGLIRRREPHLLTLQEITEYSADGNWEEPEKVIDAPSGYTYHSKILIDTRRHSHQGKWNKVIKMGNWPNNAYFAQGNAILVRDDVSVFPVWSLPEVNVKYEDWQKAVKGPTYDIAKSARPEDVLLESGLYFGERGTEPRSASVIHIVIDGHLRDKLFKKPLDIFVINVHLTTLMLEREGVPEIDMWASKIRLRQLEIIFNGIISRYNKWRKEGYPIRNQKVDPREKVENHNRYSPIWILAGDFNFTPESEEYRYIRDRNFFDLIPRNANTMGTKTSGLGKDPTLTVDYIFAGPLFEAIDPKDTFKHLGGNSVDVNDDTRISDHFPIIANLHINLPEEGSQ